MKVLIAGTPEDTLNYQNALTKLGAEFDVKLTGIDYDAYDRLLLPGGGDIAPERFGQTDQGSNPADHVLDEQQFAIFDAFCKAGKPVLGICRGEQLINVAMGGDLIQDLPTAENHRKSTKVLDNTHAVRIEKDSLMNRLYGDGCKVNSAHHQGVGKPGKGLKVTMQAADGTVEAVEHESLPVIGVQWHPERTNLEPFCTEKVTDGSLLIRHFLSM